MMLLENKECILSQNIIHSLISYLDVSNITIRSYVSGIKASDTKQFISLLHLKGVNSPTREHLLAFKKELIAKGDMRRWFDEHTRYC